MVSMQIILYGLLAFLIIASALGMLFSKNSIYSAIFLVMNFTLVAIIYLTLGAPFIALTQITVYAGAIMVLFLFLIMLVGGERLPAEDVVRYHRIFTVAGALLFLGATGFLLFWLRGSWDAMPTLTSEFASPEVIGTTLFSEYLLPFLIISFILLVAAVGAILLARGENPPPIESVQNDEE
jgi:NADH-quinone oxidoreductase subunit J